MTTPVTPAPPEAPSRSSPQATGAFPPGARVSLAGYPLPVVVIELAAGGYLVLVEYYHGGRDVVDVAELRPWEGEGLPLEMDGPQGVLGL